MFRHPIEHIGSGLDVTSSLFYGKAQESEPAGPPWRVVIELIAVLNLLEIRVVCVKVELHEKYESSRSDNMANLINEAVIILYLICDWRMIKLLCESRASRK